MTFSPSRKSLGQDRASPQESKVQFMKISEKEKGGKKLYLIYIYFFIYITPGARKLKKTCEIRF